MVRGTIKYIRERDKYKRLENKEWTGPVWLVLRESWVKDEEHTVLFWCQWRRHSWFSQKLTGFSLRWCKGSTVRRLRGPGAVRNWTYTEPQGSGQSGQGVWAGCNLKWKGISVALLPRIIIESHLHVFLSIYCWFRYQAWSMLHRLTWAAEPSHRTFRPRSAASLPHNPTQCTAPPSSCHKYMKIMLIRRELSELRQNYFTVKKMRDFPTKKKNGPRPKFWQRQ